MQLDSITLPDDLLWVDEFEWNPVEQNTERSLSGALLVEEQTKVKGRPITLSGGSHAGWVNRATVISLVAKAETANHTMTLTLPDNRQFSVIFDRRSSSPIEAQQILPFAYPDDNYQYSLIIRLLTVEA